MRFIMVILKRKQGMAIMLLGGWFDRVILQSIHVFTSSYSTTPGFLTRFENNDTLNQVTWDTQGKVKHS